MPDRANSTRPKTVHGDQVYGDLVQGDKYEVHIRDSSDISIGGICVVLKQNVKIFSEVELELDLLDLGDHIRCKGKVVWNVQREREAEEKPLFYDIGIEFLDLAEADKNRLAAIVNRLVKNNA